jgi:hypothetical protein
MRRSSCNILRIADRMKSLSSAKRTLIGMAFSFDAKDISEPYIPFVLAEQNEFIV